MAGKSTIFLSGLTIGLVVFAILFIQSRPGLTDAEVAENTAKVQKSRAKWKADQLAKEAAEKAAEEAYKKATADVDTGVTPPPTEKPAIPGGFYVAGGITIAALFFTGLVVVLRRHKMDVDGEYTGESVAPQKPKAADRDAIARLEDVEDGGGGGDDGGGGGGGGGGGAIVLEMAPPKSAPPPPGPQVAVYNPFAR